MLLSIPLLLYTFLLIVLLKSLFKIEKKTHTDVETEISIVIPFRNEQSNLHALLQSLQNQTYGGTIEIILVDDQSTDDSVKIIKNAIKQYPHKIVLLSSKFDSSKKLSSKQQALDLGIKQAQSNWIALTDADMILTPTWLHSLVKSKSTGSGMIFGHTSIYNPATVFEFLQSFQLSFLFATAHSFHKSGIEGSCMGNNLLISKEAYLASGGHEAIGYSIVEDRALMAHLKKSGYRIDAVTPFLPYAQTYPCKTWNEFKNQMKRWAAGGFTWKSNLLPIALLFSIQNILFLCSIIQIMPSKVFYLSIFNFFLTWCFIIISFKKIKSSQKARWFPLFYFFLQLESLFFLFHLIFKRQIVWKNRKV